jgi:hypothetical protein
LPTDLSSSRAHTHLSTSLAYQSPRRLPAVIRHRRDVRHWLSGGQYRSIANHVGLPAGRFVSASPPALPFSGGFQDDFDVRCRCWAGCRSTRAVVIGRAGHSGRHPVQLGRIDAGTQQGLPDHHGPVGVLGDGLARPLARVSAPAGRQGQGKHHSTRLPSWSCEFDSRHPLHSKRPNQRNIVRQNPPRRVDVRKSRLHVATTILQPPTANVLATRRNSEPSSQQSVGPPRTRLINSGSRPHSQQRIRGRSRSSPARSSECRRNQGVLLMVVRGDLAGRDLPPRQAMADEQLAHQDAR